MFIYQFYWPLANDNTVTAWIPLQAIPLEMGPLSFWIGSQRILSNRDIAISDESEPKIGRSAKFFNILDMEIDLTFETFRVCV